MEERKKKRTSLHVGCILDEFSYHCFSPECILEPINQTSSIENYDFILCESVWNAIGSGISLNKEHVKFLIYYDWLRKLIEKARSLGIPTVFWNKEDNYHFHDFLPVAKLFDHIFTTDERCLSDYRRYCPLAKSIGVLMFAAQPTTHNPIGLFSRQWRGDVFFPGSWYNDKKKRNIELFCFLNVSDKFKVDIYDRNYKDIKKKPNYPPSIWCRVYQGMPYDKILLKYFEYPAMFNVNTVLGSPTMFARRVPEALACGTAVISPPSEAIANYFFKNIFYSRTTLETEKHLNYLQKPLYERRKEVIQAIRHVHIFHTYLNRLLQIVSVIPKSFPGINHGFTLLIVPHSTYPTSFDFSFVTINRVERLDLDKVDTTKALIHSIFSKKEGYLSIVYEGNEYTSLYLCDMYHAFQYTESVVVGKECVQTSSSILHEGREHIYTSNLHPHTLCFSLEEEGGEEILLSTLGWGVTEKYSGYAVSYDEFVYHPERFF